MTDFLTKAGLIDTLQVERALWDELIDQISPGWMLLPLPNSLWTVKDIVAHITWYEKEMIEMLRKRALTGSELWRLPPEQRNETIYKENRLRGLEEVLAESIQVYQDLLRELKQLSDEELNDPVHFAGMPGSWKPWEVLLDNTYRHYRDHAPAIQAWMDSL